VTTNGADKATAQAAFPRGTIVVVRDGHLIGRVIEPLRVRARGAARLYRVALLDSHAHVWGFRTFTERELRAELRCAFCGCTDSRSCPSGCWWITTNPPRCSNCATR
jgi:hypothetical protein